ncbi:MAG: NAD(+) diphosphatase [Sphingomonadaceae bacterium]|nr:NAD(+) diphosphatase [Sphingomonadaceae bacterium]
MAHAPGFTGSPLDRAEHIRLTPEAFEAARADPAARLLRLDGIDPVLDGGDGLGWDALAQAPADAPLALLGLIDGIPHFTALVADPTRDGRSPGIFAVLDRLHPGDAATFAAARSLISWHARHRFCANCGTPTDIFRAGWGRRCPSCNTEHFPRVDPVVIMLAEHGTGADARVLIGRQPSFPPQRFSALAGFLEPAESIEEAVARELHEEAGVRATRVRYVTSQPWPFPSQLMIACIACVDDDAITLDRNELDDAKWVTRAEVADALAGAADASFIPPPRFAIAYTLFERWLEGA